MATITPSARELGDLELLLSGGYAPLAGFCGSADARSISATGRLSDGTPWPVPITLTVPDAVVAAGEYTLTDPEGAPLASISVTETWTGPGGRRHVAGPVRPLGVPAHGTFRRLRLSPAEARSQLGTGPVLARATSTPLLNDDINALCAEAKRLEARVLLLAAVGDTGFPAEPLIRALLAARPHLPARALIVPVPLSRVDDRNAEIRLWSQVAAAYGASHFLAERSVADVPIPLVVVPTSRPDLAPLLDFGADLPAPPEVAAELRAARPPRHRRGVVVFFTGLSGSGKSTLARGLHDALLERGGRTVTLLDGDIVRRMLSAGLGFSRSDRDLNIRRIGFVAAEIARHGGLAICAPIAPYTATRSEVRDMVTQVGDFLLVHVATPLSVCEARDRKGLYAKARTGDIPEFTGISDPYETPTDADLVLDTSDITVDEAVERVLRLLVDGGWLAG